MGNRLTRATRLIVGGLALIPAAAAAGQGTTTAIDRDEFIFERAPFASAHASTILETNDGLIAAWFAGTREGAPDVGIWLSRQRGSTWSPPVEVANGAQPDGTRFPCWNPVLFQPRGGPITLYYKVGPSPREWWGMRKTSSDGGQTWSSARRLPAGILGPIKNKPVQLPNGTIVSPSSTESALATNEWRVHFELSHDGGDSWSAVSPAPAATGPEIDAIQPSVLMFGDGRLEAIGRTRAGKLFDTWSSDGGRTWTALSLLALPNPNSGIDAVTLRDGRQLVVYNHTTSGRTPLNVAVSTDGHTWTPIAVLEHEPGEYSYPAVIQTSDGRVHVTYTWQRQRIKHVILDTAALRPLRPLRPR